MKHLIFLSLFFSFVPVTKAQNNLGKALKEQLVNDWELAKSYTNEYLNAMPAEKYGFRPQDSIRSFAEQMLHLAQVTSAMVANGTGSPRLFAKGRPLEQTRTAHTKDSVMYYVNAGYDYAIKATQNMDESKWEEKVKERSMEETRFGWLLKAFAHQVHHRGQTTIYLRLLGIKPPKYVE